MENDDLEEKKVKKKFTMEIFDSPEEYFTVIYLGLFTPDFSEKFLDKKCPTREDLEKEFDIILAKVSNSMVNAFLEDILKEYEKEITRRKTIEDKASTMLTSTSISITLLTASLGIISNFSYLPLFFKIILSLFYLLPIINIISSGLLARNVLGLKYNYHVLKTSDIIGNDKFIDEITYKKRKAKEIFINMEINSYLNNIKGSFLKFSHWYYKATFITVIPLVIFVFALFICMNNSKTANEMKDKVELELNISRFENNLLRDLLDLK